MNTSEFISLIESYAGESRARMLLLVEQAHGLVIDLAQRVSRDDRTIRAFDNALFRYQRRLLKLAGSRR